MLTRCVLSVLTACGLILVLLPGVSECLPVEEAPGAERKWIPSANTEPRRKGKAAGTEHGHGPERGRWSLCGHEGNCELCAFMKEQRIGLSKHKHTQRGRENLRSSLYARKTRWSEFAGFLSPSHSAAEVRRFSPRCPTPSPSGGFCTWPCHFAALKKKKKKSL